VKTNVLFFSKPADIRQDKGNTKNVWVYDLRSNMPQFGKRTVFSKSHLSEFYLAVGGDLTTVDDAKRQAFVEQCEEGADKCRLRSFSREAIAEKDDSLDLSWIRDDSTEDSADLPEPDVLINGALEDMAAATLELKAILVELDVVEEGDEVAL